MRSLHEAERVASVRASLVALRGSERPRLLWISHALGGGVERHLDELEAAVAGRAWPLRLQPGGWSGGVVLGLPCMAELDGGVAGLRLGFTWPEDFPLLQAWLQWLGVSRLHVHHLAGFSSEQVQALMDLGLPVDLTLHDYSILGATTDGQGGQLASSMQGVAGLAQRIIAPSRSLADVVRQHLPHINITVQSHPDAEVDFPYPAPMQSQLGEHEVMRVLCLGTFTPEKGAAVLSRVARLASRHKQPVEFSLLGESLYPLPSSVAVSGAYQDVDLDRLIRDRAPHLLWLPAQVPETWCYTLSAGLRAGLPILASDIGALSERLSGRPATRLLSPRSSPEVWLKALLAMRRQMIRGGGVVEWQQQPRLGFYRAGDYLQCRRSETPKECSFPPGLDNAVRLGAVRYASWYRWRRVAVGYLRRLPLLGLILASASLRQRLKRIFLMGG